MEFHMTVIGAWIGSRQVSMMPEMDAILLDPIFFSLLLLLLSIHDSVSLQGFLRSRFCEVLASQFCRLDSLEYLQI